MFRFINGLLNIYLLIVISHHSQLFPKIYSQDVLIIGTSVSPSQWVSPSANFFSIGNISLSMDDRWISFSVIGLSWAF